MAAIFPAMSATSLKIGDVTIPGRVLIAPMTGVSDLPFRQIASRSGAAYVATEMVACDSFARGRPDVVRRAAIGGKDSDIPLPLMVVQLVGREAEWISKGAKLAEQAGADIIDFNMGCPAKEVTGALSGSALMRDPDLASRLIGAAVNGTSRPVTLKMRLGWDDANRNAPQLAARAEELGVQAITVHGRTRQQFYKGSADWRAVADVKAATKLPVIVNGDVTDVASARAALAQSGADGIMIGRGAYGRPWFAAALDRMLQTGGDALREPSTAERLETALTHLALSLKFYGDALGLRVFRKHLGWYVENTPADCAERRIIKSRLCQIDHPGALEAAMIEFWTRPPFKIVPDAPI